MNFIMKAAAIMNIFRYENLFSIQKLPNALPGPKMTQVADESSMPCINST